MGVDVTDAWMPEPDLTGAGDGLRIAVVCGRFNSHVTLRLLEGVRRGLAACGVDDAAVREAWVAGAFELPLAAKTFAASGRWDAVVAVGCVIRGDTAHFDFVAGQCAEGLLRAGLDTGVPCVFGVLTTEDLQQALDRSEGPGGHNVGEEGARTAIEMAKLWRQCAAIDDNLPVLKLVLPKGSLEKATLDLFEAADLPVRRSSEVDYKASIADPRVEDVRILRPQEIPAYVADGLFDLGIAGRDWVEETESRVVTLGELPYSKVTSNPFRIVVAVAGDAPWDKVEDLPDGVRVSTEYPGLTRRFFAEQGVDADVRLSYGATEAKIPDIVDCVVDGTETGRALRAAKLKIIGEIMPSYTALIANPASYEDPDKRIAMLQLKTLLDGVLEARGKVLVKLNVAEADLDAVIALVPSMKAPTVSKLFGDGGYAVETVVAKATVNTLIPALKDAGASDIIELPLAKIVH